MRTVFYLNPRANAHVFSVVRSHLPAGWTLLTPSSSDMSAELAACDLILVADHPVTAAHIAAAPRLRMIQHQGVGYERIDIEACRARGILVGLTPEGTTIGVAEHTVLLILALYKRLIEAAAGVHEGRWRMWDLRDRSFELQGKTVGLVGFGRIGREVARRVLAFDARVRYFDPALRGVPPPLSGVEAAPSLDDLLASADVVSLHAPMSPGNRHLMNARTLARMKPTAILVNTARGGLVDEAALAEALEQGRIGGAALDVLDQEPPPANHPLLRFDRVLITPHISAGTLDALHAKMTAAFANLERFVRGEPIRNAVPELAGDRS